MRLAIAALRNSIEVYSLSKKIYIVESVSSDDVGREISNASCLEALLNPIST